MHVHKSVQENKVEICASIIVQNYNKYMSGVDHHDQLHLTFVLGKSHSFCKYYVKLFLFLCDIGFTNAWIYYRMCNPSKVDKYGSRAEFFEAVAEEIVNPTNFTHAREEKKNH